MNKNFLTTIILFCALFSPAQDTLEISWQNCYGGSENEDRPSILKTDFGYFILSSTNSTNGDISNYWGNGDIWLTAIDSMGNFLRGRCFGGTGRDISNSIISDENGFYYLSGWTASNDGDVKSVNHGGFDRWIVKINANGAIQWEKCYGGTKDDYGPMLKISSNGNIIAYSASNSGDGDVPVNYGYLDAWITIINPENGDILKNQVFGNIGQNNIFDIVETRDDGFFFTSKAQEVEGMVQGNYHGGGDVWAVKTDSNLNIEWQKLYGGSSIDYQGWSLMELEDGYIFLAQTISNDGDVSGFHGIVGDERTYDIWVVRIDTVGNIIWQECLGGSDSDYGWEIIQSDDGGFVVFADTDSDDGDVVGLHNSYPYTQTYKDIWMVKLSAQGEIEWSRCFGGDGQERISFESILKNAEDNYIIAGSTYGLPNTGDVNCDPKGLSDLWLFEIKDCSNYMPATPPAPTGPDTLCITTDSTATYSILPAQGAWSYEWQVLPEEAGSINSDSTTAVLLWAPGWEGQAQINVRSWNDCGQSPWSEIKTSWAYSCLGIPGNPVSGTRHLNIFPNPAGNAIYFKYQLSNTSYQLSIYDIFGRIQDKIIIPQGQEQIRIDVSGYPAGVYMVVLNSGDGVVARGKFVKR